tara:strand:+ start:358 stop:540 length:183 start_codon:yes stop_codon:yes gene_type:complete
MIAVNDGDSYRAKDPEGAVEKAFAEYKAAQIERMQENFNEVQADLVCELSNRWWCSHGKA